MSEKQNNFEILLSVSVKDGVQLDQFGKKMGFVYDESKYDENYNRLPDPKKK